MLPTTPTRPPAATTFPALDLADVVDATALAAEAEALALREVVIDIDVDDTILLETVDAEEVEEAIDEEFEPDEEPDIEDDAEPEVEAEVVAEDETVAMAVRAPALPPPMVGKAVHWEVAPAG